MRISGKATVKNSIIFLFLCLAMLCAFSPARAAGTASDKQELITAIKNATRTKPATVTIPITSSLSKQIQGESFRRSVMEETNIISVSWNYSSSRCILKDIEYLDAMYCETEQDMISTLRFRAGQDVSLQLPPALYSRMRANNFAAFYALTSENGLTVHSIGYQDNYCNIVAKNVQITRNFTAVSSESALKQLFLQQADQLAAEFTFTVPDALYNQIKRQDFQYLSELTINCGMAHSTYFYSDTNNTITIRDIDYLPGKKVAVHALSGRLYELTPTEQQLYNAAANMVNQARRTARNDYDMLYALSDALMLSTRYSHTGPEKDNAIGALLYGAAECDGFADAFYLLCTLSGYDAYYQTGKGRESGESHMWNGVHLYGQTYVADVTWNNTDDQLEPWCKGFLLMGNDLAKANYTWDEAAAVFTPAKATSTALYHYYREDTAFTSVADAGKYIRKQRGGPVYLMLTHNGSRTEEQLIDALQKEANGYYYYKSAGNHLFICYTP